MSLDLNADWVSLPVAVFDCETTGLSPEEGHAVVDIACIRFERGRPVARFSSLVNPGRPIPDEATAVHGITDAMVSGAPTLAELAGELVLVCSGAAPCAYNAPFDRAFIHAVITGTDAPAFDPSFPAWIDPLCVVRKVDRRERGAGRHKLETVCRRHGVRVDGPAHRALTDALSAGHLLYTLLNEGSLKPCPLGKLLEHTERMRAEQDRDYQAYRARLNAQKSAAQ